MASFSKFCLRKDTRRLALTAFTTLGLLQRRASWSFRTYGTRKDWNEPGISHGTVPAEAFKDQSSWHSLPRGPLWKGRRGSKEALQVVRELRRAKGNHARIDDLLQTKVARLLKIDLLAVLNELQRLDEVDLALTIFCVVRREFWYKPEVYLYRDMLNCLGRNKRSAQCRMLFSELKREGIKPNSSLCLELIAAYLQHEMVPEAIEVFEEIKESGCCDRLAYRVLLKGLQGLGQSDLWLKIDKEYSEKFGEEDEMSYDKILI